MSEYLPIFCRAIPEKPEREIMGEIQAIVRQVPFQSVFLSARLRALFEVDEWRKNILLQVTDLTRTLLAVLESSGLPPNFLPVGISSGASVQITASVTFLPLLDDPCNLLPHQISDFRAVEEVFQLTEARANDYC